MWVLVTGLPTPTQPDADALSSWLRKYKYIKLIENTLSKWQDLSYSSVIFTKDTIYYLKIKKTWNYFIRSVSESEITLRKWTKDSRYNEYKVLLAANIMSRYEVSGIDGDVPAIRAIQ